MDFDFKFENNKVFVSCSDKRKLIWPTKEHHYDPEYGYINLCPYRIDAISYLFRCYNFIKTKGYKDMVR